MKSKLINFPENIRDDILSLEHNGGVLVPNHVANVCEKLEISMEKLMLMLLPVASSFAQPVISNYFVGAVAKGSKVNTKGYYALYLGANFEFSGQSLSHTIHAEQSVISNAWLQGETHVDAIATAAKPCGHCRQFLYEIETGNDLNIIIPVTENNTDEILVTKLSALLPQSFGPKDLGVDDFLMNSQSQSLSLNDPSKDPLVLKALQAASLAHAPYTKNYAGCVIELTDGSYFEGRYAENAAFNPSLSPLLSAYSNLVFHHKNVTENPIKRVILVERKSKISQRDATQSVLNILSSGLKVEYFQAEVKE